MEIVNSLLPASLDGVNYRTGRGGEPYEIDAIVIHVSEGDIGSVRAWFKDPRAGVSAHYIVRKDGVIEQFVREEDRAYHAGQLVNPTNTLVLDRRPYTPNSWAIGIEHEGDGTHDLTSEQRAASYALITDIRRRRPKITLDRLHIMGHHEVKSSKTCPGKIDVPGMIRDLAVAEHVADEAAQAAYPRVVYSRSLARFLVVTRYVSDTEWYFVPLSQVVGGQRAGTPLSQMPLRP